MKDNLYNMLKSQKTSKSKPKAKSKALLNENHMNESLTSRKKFSDLNVLDRQQIWQRGRESKIEKARMDREHDEVKDCPFKPSLYKYRRKDTVVSSIISSVNPSPSKYSSKQQPRKHHSPNKYQRESHQSSPGRVFESHRTSGYLPLSARLI